MRLPKDFLQSVRLESFMMGQQRRNARHDNAASADAGLENALDEERADDSDAEDDEPDSCESELEEDDTEGGDGDVGGGDASDEVTDVDNAVMHGSDSNSPSTKLSLRELEARAKRAEQKQASTTANDEAERLETNMQGAADEVQLAPDAEAEEDEELVGTEDLNAVNSRIQATIKVLSNFQEMREAGVSRSTYLKHLERDLRAYYGYNQWYVGEVLRMFHPAEAVEFLEASERPRPVTLRSNPLKARRREVAGALISRGVNLDPLGSWTKVGLLVYDSKVPIGATPEYMAGQYMLQGAASLLPCMSLSPRENERVLDMAAAPGGKATHLAAMMKNSGVLFANEANKERLHALVGNVQRMGVCNTVVCCYDGRKLPKVINQADRVLLDAPCTGTGVVSRDPSVKASKSEEEVFKSSQQQRELLLAAIDTCDAKSATGGVVVYSTCSFTVSENEDVIDMALRKRDVRVIESGLEFGRPGFTKFGSKRYHASLAKARRFYPHVHNLEGFFVCKLQKMSAGGPTRRPGKFDEHLQQPDETGYTSVLDGSEDGKVKRVRKRKKGQVAVNKAENVDEHEEGEDDGDGDDDDDPDNIEDELQKRSKKQPIKQRSKKRKKTNKRTTKR